MIAIEQWVLEAGPLAYALYLIGLTAVGWMVWTLVAGIFGRRVHTRSFRFALGFALLLAFVAGVLILLYVLDHRNQDYGPGR